MNTGGGAWDSARNISAGRFGGKNSPAHVTVVGDTVRPMKIQQDRDYMYS